MAFTPRERSCSVTLHSSPLFSLPCPARLRALARSTYHSLSLHNLAFWPSESGNFPLTSHLQQQSLTMQYSRSRKAKEPTGLFTAHSPTLSRISAAPRSRLWLVFLGLCVLATLRQFALQPSSSLPRPVVTLASTKLRVSRELPYTLRSLLSQSLQPQAIWVHVPREDRDAFEERVAQLPGASRALFADPRVSIRYVKDVGPATKLIPALSTLLESPQNLTTPLVVLDDDHLYHPRLLESLVSAHVETGRKVAVGSRGWRIRRDLKWGVQRAEFDRHVHLGWFVAKPYQAGILTANDAYLVLPSFFATNSCDASTTNRPVNPNPAVLDPFEKGNPEAAHLVDDIWISGQLARNCVPRFIVPVAGANIDVTHTHVLEGHMRDDGISRARANDLMLRFFRDDWARENVWYELGGNGEQPVHTWAFSQWFVTFEKGWRWFWGR